MQPPLVDFSFLYEISDNDPQYISDVIEIFLGTMPDGLQQLEHLINNTDDWDALYKQAHFLKSSVSVVKVRNMFENLGQIEALAKSQSGKPEIESLMRTLSETFKEAHPVLIAEMQKK